MQYKALYSYLYSFDMATLLPLLLVAIVVPLWVSAKQKITISRIGYVNFGKKDKPKLAGLLGGIVGFGVAFVFVFALTAKASPWLDFLIANSMIVLGISTLIVTSLCGYALGLKRFYAYGLLSFVLLTTGHFLGIFFAYITLVISLTVLATGFVLLARFIKKYSLKGDQNSAQQ